MGMRKGASDPRVSMRVPDAFRLLIMMTRAYANLDPSEFTQLHQEYSATISLMVLQNVVWTPLTLTIPF